MPDFNEIQGAFGLLAILAGVGAFAASRLRVDYCPKCGHCVDQERQRKAALERKRLEDDRRSHDYWHPRPAPGCNRYGCRKDK